MGVATRRITAFSTVTPSTTAPSLEVMPMPAFSAWSTTRLTTRMFEKSPAVSEPMFTPLQPLATARTVTSTQSIRRPKEKSLFRAIASSPLSPRRSRTGPPRRRSGG